MYQGKNEGWRSQGVRSCFYTSGGPYLGIRRWEGYVMLGIPSLWTGRTYDMALTHIVLTVSLGIPHLRAPLWLIVG